jgi:hypothetical protein
MSENKNEVNGTTGAINSNEKMFFGIKQNQFGNM